LAANIISSTNIPKKKTYSSMFPTASEDGLDLLKHLLVFNPNLRYSAAEALNHRYVKDFHDEAE
jgi:serine/threonine protein kinase